MNKIIRYIKGSYNELRYKVSWPKYASLQSSSTLVLIASLIFALVIWLMDKSFEYGLTLFYESFK